MNRNKMRTASFAESLRELSVVHSTGKHEVPVAVLLVRRSQVSASSTYVVSAPGYPLRYPFQG